MKTNHFFSWLKTRLEITPEKKLDQLILNEAKIKFKSQTNSLQLLWTTPSKLILASSAVLIIGFIYNQKYSLDKSHQVVLSESPDMLMNFDSIELMADAAKLSDAEWEKINDHK